MASPPVPPTSSIRRGERPNHEEHAGPGDDDDDERYHCDREQPTARDYAAHASKRAATLTPASGSW
jgi:hypothetical protein